MKKLNSTNASSCKTDFIIASIDKNTGAMSISANPAVHEYLNEAKTEAARLATSVPAKKFVVLKVEAIASANTVNWE